KEARAPAPAPARTTLGYVSTHQAKSSGGLRSAVQFIACDKKALVIFINPDDLIHEHATLFTGRIPNLFDSGVCHPVLLNSAVFSRRQDQPDGVEGHEALLRTDPINHVIRCEVVQGYPIVGVFFALHRWSKEHPYLLRAASNKGMST